MRYGFVIDQDRCIGCHACTVACKEEHQVPIGVFRTWVKYVEKGEFPHTSRHFGVMRCNHCDSAPCIEICPTRALYRRSDGIVDFDNQRCIGCKSCMQACPYDALYIDPNTNTAAKCNFCAHRVENDLEPACVIVCPVQAIIAGDLDNPASTASQIVATQKVSVRKPEKGTEPKLFYKGIEGDLLQPTRLSRQNTFVFAEQRDGRPVQPSFDPAATREVYDVAHPAPWGWKITAYLWTKSIAGGVMMVAVILQTQGLWYRDPRFTIAAPIISLIALAATMALLVFDLKRPERFYFLLTKPNFRSWLVLGAYVLMAFGACVTAWLIYGIRTRAVPPFLVWATAVLGAAAAAYSAFLFRQARGRDLWHSPLFFFQLVVQGALAGGAVWIFLLDGKFGMPDELGQVSAMDEVLQGAAMIDVGICMIASLILVLFETLPRTKNADTRQAIKGLDRIHFWGMGIMMGLIVPFLIESVVLFSSPALPYETAVFSVPWLVLAGLWFYEREWVRAGQSVPLS